MPRFEMPDQSLIDSAREELKKQSAESKETSRFLDRREIVALLEKKYTERIIGDGAECIVVPIEGEDEKVAAYSVFKYHIEMSPAEAKKIFYLQRIFSTLFPHNFPHFYASFGKTVEDKKRLTGTIRQKIKGVKKTSLGYKFKGKDREITPSIRYPIQKVYEELAKMGINHLAMDTADANYMLGADGGEYYVDTLRFVPQGIKNPNAEKVTQYMKEHNYSDGDIEIVKKSIERLTQL